MKPFRLWLPTLLLLLSCLPVGADEAIVLSQRDDPLARIAAKIASEAYRRIGLNVSFEILPSERALQAADSGLTGGDLVRMAGIEKLYPNLVQVPEPMLNYDNVAFTTGLGFKVDGWDSLRPFKLCILRGMKLAEQATEGMDRTVGNDVPQLIMMLRAGRCEVAVLANIVWPEIDRLKMGPLRSLDPPISSVPLFLYVNKRYADMVPKLRDALRQMRSDGALGRILDESDREIQAARQRNTFLPAK
jgi:polar amino acid transport system substrate-binding protein